MNKYTKIEITMWIILFLASVYALLGCAHPCKNICDSKTMTREECYDLVVDCRKAYNIK